MMVRKGDKNVLIIGSDKIVSYKIGLEQPFNHLQKAGVCQFDVRPDDEIDITRLAKADVVIFFRTVQAEAYKQLQIAREMGKRTVYVIDDHFLAMPNSTEIGKYYQDPNKRKMYVKFLQNAHIVKVASPFFGRHLEAHFNPNKVVYFPGSVDFSLFTGLEKRKDKNEKKVVIGYEGSKKQAFDPVIDALQDIVRTYGDKVRIEFFGYIPEQLEGKPQVSFEPHMTDYRSFMKRLYQSQWDIGLAPLNRSLLHDCKTNNKFREYAACRIPAIYSARPAYQDWVRHRENGMLVSEKKEDWYKAIAELIEKPELRREIMNNAERVARDHFSVELCAERWRTQILS